MFGIIVRPLFCFYKVAFLNGLLLLAHGLHVLGVGEFAYRPPKDHAVDFRLDAVDGGLHSVFCPHGGLAARAVPVESCIDVCHPFRVARLGIVAGGRWWADSSVWVIAFVPTAVDFDVSRMLPATWENEFACLGIFSPVWVFAYRVGVVAFFFVFREISQQSSQVEEHLGIDNAIKYPGKERDAWIYSRMRKRSV